MFWWKLSEEQTTALDALHRSTTDERTARNAKVILLSAGGKSKEWIAREFCCSLGTVNNIRRGYRQKGLAGLKPAPRPGRRSRATPQYRARLRQVAQMPPQSLGYGARRWSARQLAVHLEHETGIRFSEDQMMRLMRQEGFASHRPRVYRVTSSTYQEATARPA